MKKIIFLSIISLLVISGCNKAKAPEEDFEETNNVATEEQVENNTEQEEANSEEEVNVEEEVEEKDMDVIAVSDVDFVLYENKAMGYQVMRPDKWYWQHFMKNEISAAGGNDLIDDYLIIDKNGITGLGSEYLGQIVIEKSRMNAEDIQKDKNEYKQTDVSINGMSAKRYELQTDESHNLFPNRKMIEYHIEKDGDLYRLMYVSNGEQDAEAVFEKVVKSFSFDDN